MIMKYDPDAFHHHPNPLIRFVERKRVKAIVKLITDNNKDENIIEVGCGAGNILEKIGSGRLFGADISASILSKASQKLKGMVHLLQADAQSLPYRDKSFGYVICSEVLEHVLDPLSVIGEIRRILNGNGVAVISIPNESLINWIKKALLRIGLFKILFNRGKEYPKIPQKMDDEWHLHNLTLKEWLNLLQKFLRVSAVKKIPFFWIPLRYVICLENQDELP